MVSFVYTRSPRSCLPATLSLILLLFIALAKARAHHRSRERSWSSLIDYNRDVQFPTVGEYGKEVPTSYNQYLPNAFHDTHKTSLSKPQKHLGSKTHKKAGRHHSNDLLKDHNSPSRATDGAEWRQSIDAAEFRTEDGRPHLRTIEVPPATHVEVGSDVKRKKIQVVLDNKTDRGQSLLDEDAAMGTPPGPHFDRSLPRNISVQNGKTAVLSCRVNNRDNRKVSWIRHGDLHILTVDQYKYSTDQRVSVIHNVANKEWVLRIKGAQHSDEGKYECQVSTKPVLSYIVNLRVVVPMAQILNAPDIYVHRGSLINLTCIINHGTDHPVYIYWFQNKQMVNIDEPRTTLKMSTHEHGKTVSSLLMHKAESEDSGRYTCKPSNGEAASATLHILNGELQAAMQTNGGTSFSGCTTCSLIIYWLIYFLTTHHLQKCLFVLI